MAKEVFQRPNYQEYLLPIILVVSDLILLSFSAYLSLFIRNGLNNILGKRFAIDNHIATIPYLLLFTILVFFSTGLYKTYGRYAINEFREIIKSTTVVTIIYAFFIGFLFKFTLLSRAFVIILWILNILFVSSGRFLILNRLSFINFFKKRVVIIGNANQAMNIVNALYSSRRLMLYPTNILSEDRTSIKNKYNIPISKYSLEECQKIIASGTQSAIYSYSAQDIDESLFDQLSTIFREVFVVFSSSPFGALWVDVYDFLGFPAMRLRNQLLNKINQSIKRIIDLLLSSIFIILSSPLFIIILLIIKLDSKGSFLYNQVRVGLYGNPINIYKFRTMHTNSSDILETFLNDNPDQRDLWKRFKKLDNDPRVTRIGKILRKFSLDELPQLFNVFEGKISFVGPRPYMSIEIDQSQLNIQRILSTKPGLTGLWQVMGRNVLTFEERIWFDNFYISHWTYWMDLYILYKSFWIILSGSGK